MVEQGTKESTTKTFVVVIREPSAAVFEQGQSLGVDGFPSNVGPVNITCTTHYVNKGTEITVPGHLWIDVRGGAPSLDGALLPFAKAGLNMIPVLSLGANAAVHDSEIELGFDNTVGITERDYFQSYVLPEPEVIHESRRIDISATRDQVRSAALSMLYVGRAIEAMMQKLTTLLLIKGEA